MPRRGFTLLEVLLATAMASVVIFSALGVMNMLQRSDARLAGRYRSMTEMATLHGLFNRAFQTLVFAPSSGAVPAAQDTQPLTAFGAALAAAADAQIRPRIILTADPRYLGIAPPSPEWGDQPIQVLEVVCDDVPAGYVLPPIFNQIDLGGQVLSGGAPRGVFELLPDSDRDGAFALWWRPVRPEGTAWVEGTVRPTDTAVRLASNIAFMRIQFFRGDERHVEFTATTERDIPAYVEIELRTVDNLYFNWMFEVNKRAGVEQTIIDPNSQTNTTTGTGGEETRNTGTPGRGPGGPAGPGTTNQPGQRQPGQRPQGPTTQTPNQPRQQPGPTTQPREGPGGGP
ncbi:MAG: prepilin-type N-terminal cleavage/methylation domain-containing protein [Phycisphaeraceae bacterium]|nr:prepilin-type N-terminal cleavage/methylation domain-containing protein [Phycisphaeraceae bacterium]MCW5754858.1 prepilin-type N-terminal cleavage/methylation domain-containing protein [Phycisphaeraceae bacterium]